MMEFSEYEFVGMHPDYARRLAGWCRDYLEEDGYANEVGRSEFSKHYHDGICSGMRIALARVDHLEVNLTRTSLRLINTLTGEIMFEYKFGGESHEV